MKCNYELSLSGFKLQLRVIENGGLWLAADASRDTSFIYIFCLSSSSGTALELHWNCPAFSCNWNWWRLIGSWRITWHVTHLHIWPFFVCWNCTETAPLLRAIEIGGIWLAADVSRDSSLICISCLSIYWNCTGTALELHWNRTETALNCDSLKFEDDFGIFGDGLIRFLC